MKSQIVFLFAFMLCISFASAFEFDNIKSYDAISKEVTIKNAYGLPEILGGSEIAKVKLLTDLDVKVGAGYQKVAEFQITSYEQYEEAIKNLELYNIKEGMKPLERQIDFKYKTFEDIEVNDYDSICEKSFDEKNGTAIDVCTQKLIGSHFETIEIWKDLSSMDMKVETLTIGLFTDVQVGDKIEWIPNLYGVRVQEWASWTADLNVGLISYYKFDETTGTTATDILGRATLTHYNTPTVGQTGKINLSTSYDGSNDYSYTTTRFSTNQDLSHCLWINTTSLPVAAYSIIKQRTIGSNNNWWDFGLDSNGYSFGVAVNGPVTGFIGSHTNNVWVFYCVTLNYTSKNFTLYKDGSVVHTEIASSWSGLPASSYQNGMYIMGHPDIGWQGDGAGYISGKLDEMGFWNRSLTSAEITQLYNSGNGMTYRTTFDPIVTLNSPINSYNSSNSLITFNTSVEGDSLINITHYDNSTGTFAARNTTLISGVSNSSLIVNNYSDGTYIWNSYACDINGCAFASSNRTFFIDTGRPTITANLTNTTLYAWGNNMTLNYNVTHNPDLTGVTCWYNYNNTNTTLNCSQSQKNITTVTGFYNIIVYANDSAGNNAIPVNLSFVLDSSIPQITLNYPTSLINYGAINGTLQLNFTATDSNLANVWYNYNGTNVSIAGAVSGVANLSNITLSTKKNVTIYANDTAGNLNATTFSWDYRVFENSRTYNSTSYETAYETFSSNLTANSSLTAVKLVYNGTEYSAVDGAGIWSYSMDIPTTNIGNNSVRYKYTYAGADFYSDYSYQNISSIVFTICNATYATKFINFTFKDENTLAFMNATMQSASWTYYLGTGSVSKSYIFSNTSSIPSYTFCASPVDRTLYASPSITYLNTSYPARFYTPGVLTLSNVTTNTTLYLLNAVDGIYVTFVTMTNANQLISNALIEITRLISGSTVIIGEGTTDSAGSYTIWLNPNYDHTVIGSKTGYGTNTQTIRPTQSSYTLILSSSQNYSYVSNFEGLLWGFFPRERINASVSTNFGFNVSSLLGNIVKCKIELLNNNKSTVLATGEYITANGSYCSVQTTYTPTSSDPRMKGRLLIDTGNGYEILEEDAYWILLTYNTTGMTFTDWFNGLQNLELSYFNNDEQHREFTNILIFFLVVMVICASLNTAGWDIQTQGGMIFLVGILVILASVPGFLNLAGVSPFTLIDKYFVAIVYSLFMIGFGARSMS